ncbi:hypothetical protein J4E81_005769 [Alternaria sp. BMP 2799]|nr:hypothetical protein J4E81_005769 [Alternaria sp. BMP 2799]
MSDDEEASLPATIEIDNNAVLIRNIETMMEELGLPDRDHHAANVNADAEVVAARRSVAQAKELLKLADERFHRVHDISIAMGAEKGRKIRAFRMLLKKIREAMREEGWTDLGEASEEEADSSDSS